MLEGVDPWVVEEPVCLEAVNGRERDVRVMGRCWIGLEGTIPDAGAIPSPEVDGGAAGRCLCRGRRKGVGEGVDARPFGCTFSEDDDDDEGEEEPSHAGGRGSGEAERPSYTAARFVLRVRDENSRSRSRSRSLVLEGKGTAARVGRDG